MGSRDSSPGGKAPGAWIWHHFHLVPRSKNAWRYISTPPPPTPPWRVSEIKQRDFTFTFTFRTDWERLWTGCWGDDLDLRGRSNRVMGERCIMRSFVNPTFQQKLLGSLNQGRRRRREACR
jgi:hypothetical protein